MIERDFRLTGVKRGQIDNVEAPAGFEGEQREYLYCLAVY